MKKQFLALAEDNKDVPIGEAIWTRIHPEDVFKTDYTRWKFTANTHRMPEFIALGLGMTSNRMQINLEMREIVIDTTLPKPGGPLTVVMSVDGTEVANMTTKRSAPAALTATEIYDAGIDPGSPVSPSYKERRPFESDVKINSVTVELK